MHDPAVLAKRKTKRERKWKGDKRQRLFIENWISPESETFGNAYQSARRAGFSNSYALNITNLAPSWLSENIERLNLEQEHIKQGIQKLAINAPNSKSPDDTRLKAYETLAKITGMIDNKNTNITQVNVQPILGGQSMKKVEVEQVDK